MRKKVVLAIYGGDKVVVYRNRLKKRLLLPVLIVALALLSTSAAFAQGSIFGSVVNSDASIPANGEISFYGYLDNTDEEIRIETSVGAGYDNGSWYDDFQNYLTEAPGNPYDYHFYNPSVGEGFILSKLIPNNSFQQEDIALQPVSWPAAPIGLVGRAVSLSSVVVSWNALPGLTYHVYRRLATSNGSFFRIDDPTGSLGNPGVADSFFVDTGVDGVSNYQYLIIAEDGIGTLSPHSAILIVASAAVVAPSVAAIAPASGFTVGGDAVTITGLGFDIAGATATIGGVPLTSVAVISPFELTGLTPPGAAGPADVVVTNIASGQSSAPLVGGFTYLVNNPPVLDPIGPQTVAEGGNLNLLVTASDLDGTIPALSTSTLPANATFADHGDGSGTFDFNPDFTQEGTYNVTFYAADGIATDSEVVVVTVTHTNQSPVLDPIGPKTVAEGANLNFTVTSSDPDGEIPALTTSILPTNATFLDNGDGTGTFDFNPDFTQEGSYPVTFYAFDGTATDSETVTVTVTGTNQAPVLDPVGDQTVAEGANLNVTITASDPDGTIPALSTTTLPANATFVDNGDGTGTFDFNPDFTQEGAYPVTFYASDGSATDSEAVTITVTGTNLPPVLDPIGPQTVAEGANLNLTITASDPDGTIPALSTSTLPANATFADNGDGTGTFDFNPDFTQEGAYPVTFYASDGVATDSETVTVTVTGTNLAPVLDPIGDKTAIEGGNLNFAVTASDPDGTIPALSTSALPANATFLDNGDGTGTFDFNPDFTQEGAYPVTFYASDGAAIDSELITITVQGTNLPPVLDPIGPQTVAEGGNLNLLVTASDLDGTIPALSTSTLPANATFADHGDGSGTFDFNPDFTQEGTYNVTFYAADGIATDSEVVVITVTHTNQSPVLDPIGPKTVAEGGNLNFTVTSSDPDGEIPALTTSILPTNAIFLDNGDGTGTFDFNPDFTQEGAYPVTFYAFDGTATDSETVTVTVTGTNQAPVLDPVGDQTVAEGGNLNLLVTGSDPDGTIPALSTTTLPANATFVDNGDGTGTFDFSPDFTQEGAYPVTFYASDGSATDSEAVTITVTGTNLPPVLDPIGPQTVAEGANLNLTITASDPDGTIPALSTSTLPANATFADNGDGTGTFDFNPDFTQEGTYPVTFYASDGVATDSETVTVTVTGTNQAPVLDPIGDKTAIEGGNLNFAVTASDPDGTIPALSTSVLPANATFVDNGDGTGTFDFNPDFTQEGAYPVIFYADDGAATDSESITITVQGTNLPPVLDPIGPQTVAEGANLNLTITASDPDGTIPALSTSTLPANATFVDNGDGTGTFDFNPDFTQEGAYSVTFYAGDGLATDSESVAITVTHTNQPPVLDPIGPKLVDEGANLNFIVTSSDGDGDIPALSTSILPANATFVDNGDGTGTFDFNPDFTQQGAYDVTFYANDGQATDSEVVTITVNEAGNQAPVLDPIGPQSVDENANINLIVTASDPDAEIPTLSAVNLPSGATFVDNSDGSGTFDFTPDYNQAGVYNITFIASDGLLADSETVALTVNDVNRPPVLDPIGPQIVDEGANLNFTVTASDLDGTIPVLTTSALPVNATFINNGDGSGVFDFTPDFTQGGTAYDVTFYANDGTDIDSETVVITVNDAGNQAPVLDSIGSQVVYETANLNLLITASDPDGEIPSLSALNLPVNATFVDNLDGTGTFDFTPSYTQAGDYLVTFKAFDGILVDSEVVTITVLNTNRPPILDPIGPRTVTEGQTLNLTITASDPDGAVPALSTSALPANATFTDNANGTGAFGFSPDFTQAGTYSITFYASDGTDIDSELVAITVGDAGNQAPVLDSIGPRIVSEGANLNFPVTASDPDGDIPALSAINLPTNATFVDNLDGTGTFDFTPDFTQAGIYGVTFIASDGILSDSEVVLLTVQELGNQPPVIDPVGPQTVYEGDTLVINLTATDPEGGNIIFNYSTSSPMVGVRLVDNGDGTAIFTYMPDNLSAGVDTVRIFATDNGTPSLSDVEVIVITTLDINQPPVLDSIGPFGVRVGKTLQFTVTASDSTAGPNNVIYLTVSNLPANATFTDNGNGTGLFSFSPDYSQVGLVTVRFIAIDNGVPPMSDQIDVHIDVVATNQPPVIDDMLPQMVLEGTTMVMTVTATDPDGTIPTLSASKVPANASFTDHGDGTGTFTFSPNFIQSGLYGVVFRAYDGVDVDKATVLIQVLEAGNQRPELFTIGAQQTTEAVELAFTVSGGDPDSTTPSFTADPVPLGATFSDNGDGTADFSWTPGYTQAGDYYVMFVASDGELADSEEVHIQVLEGPNQKPVLEPVSDYQVNELQIVGFKVYSSDLDSVVPILTTSPLPGSATFTDNQDYTGTFYWETSYEDSGTHVITFYATDPDSTDLVDSVSSTIVVVNVNREPFVWVSPPNQVKTVNEGDTLIFRVQGDDFDGDVPTLSINRTIENFSFVDDGNGLGTLTITPNYMQAGLYGLTFIAHDGALDSLGELLFPDDSGTTESINFIVNNVPVAPVLYPIGPKTVMEGELLVFEVDGYHPGGGSFDVFAANLPEGANLTGFGPPKAFRWIPSYVQSGIYSVLFYATDGIMADSEYVTITVTEAGNQTPYFEDTAPDTIIIAYGDTAIHHIVATDPDLEPLTLELIFPPANSVFVDSGNGSAAMTFIPDNTQIWATYIFRYVATDIVGVSDTLIKWVRVVAFLRGDSNSDGQIDVADISYLITYVFRHGPAPVSSEAADANHDNRVDVTDAIYLVNYIFRKGPAPEN